MNIYALKDNKLGYMQPFCIQNDELAKRAYKNILNDAAGTLVSKNPEDFDLYCLGTYNQDSGVIKSEVLFVANHTIVNG